jgi:hypothetical protein
MLSDSRETFREPSASFDIRSASPAGIGCRQARLGFSEGSSFSGGSLRLVSISETGGTDSFQNSFVCTGPNNAPIHRAGREGVYPLWSAPSFVIAGAFLTAVLVFVLRLP